MLSVESVHKIMKVATECSLSIGGELLLLGAGLPLKRNNFLFNSLQQVPVNKAFLEEIFRWVDMFLLLIEDFAEVLLISGHVFWR